MSDCIGGGKFGMAVLGVAMSAAWTEPIAKKNVLPTIAGFINRIGFSNRFLANMKNVNKDG
jgi:hypothetical protein